MSIFDDIGSGITGGISNIVGGIEDIIPGVKSGRDAQAAYRQQTQDLIDRINGEWTLPVYDQTPLTQKEYTLLSMYAPQVAGFVQQQAPQLLANISNQGTQAQTQALNQLSDLSQTGTDAGTRAQYESANMAADQAMRSNRANALAALAQRGLSTSGATLNADINAGQSAAEQQRQASLQAASDASQRRVQAIQGLGNLGTQVAGQQQQQQEFNANTLNNYNQLLADRRQQYQNYLSDTQNQANLYNQQQTQGVANANTGIENQTNLMNRQRQDAIMNAMTNAQNDKLKTEAGMTSNMNQQGLQYGMQQSQNMTNTFLGLAGLGVGLAMGNPAAGAAGAMAATSANQPASYGPAPSNYNLGGDTGYSPQYSQEGAITG